MKGLLKLSLSVFAVIVSLLAFYDITNRPFFSSLLLKLGFDKDNLFSFYSGISTGILPFVALMTGYILWRGQRKADAFAQFWKENCEEVVNNLSFIYDTFRTCREFLFERKMSKSKKIIFIKSRLEEIDSRGIINKFKNKKTKLYILFQGEPILKEMNWVFEKYTNLYHYLILCEMRGNFENEILENVHLIDDIENKVNSIENKIKKYMRFGN